MWLDADTYIQNDLVNYTIWNPVGITNLLRKSYTPAASREWPPDLPGIPVHLSAACTVHVPSVACQLRDYEMADATLLICAF